MESFEQMGLSPDILRALKSMKFDKPTEVQGTAIPEILNGRDVYVRSKTGTGKTAAFLIPIVQQMQPGRDPGALVVVPTRELALQIDGVARKLTANTRLHVTTVYGGVSLNPQMDSLDAGTDLLIGTPGRIIDLIERGAAHLGDVRFLVLDEADMMLDMGFIDDIEYILRSVPPEKQTMLFSATSRKEILDIADRHMRNPYHLSIGPDDELVVTSIKHTYTIVPNTKKIAALLSYLKARSTASSKSIIFARTQIAASALYGALHDFNMKPLLLHGGMTQARREKTMRQFKTEKGGIMIATNVAARGLDISNITDIINFDVPDDPIVYIHRVGRSARMGKDGRAFTIFSTDQTRELKNIEYYSNIRMEREHVDTDEFGNVSFGKYFQRSRGRGFGDDRYGGRRPQGRGDRRDSGSSRGRYGRDRGRDGGGHDNRGHGGSRDRRGGHSAGRGYGDRER